MASQQLIEIIIKAVDEASSAAEKVDNSLRKIGDSSSRLSKIPGFDAMRNKLSSVATTLDGKLGGAITKAITHFNNLKTRVTGVASNIRSKMGTALDGVRAKLSSLSNGSKGLASSMNFLKGAVSMTAGMIGYDLVNSIMETTKASLNARSSMQSFANRLKMSSAEVEEYQKSLDDLQNTFKKVDMDVVGQQATDMAYRLGLPKTSLTQLTETTAIFNDAMIRNGRSSEDAMMAMADAMDGQFVRLKEIGIGQEDLMRNGWDGDINNKTGLLEAMNKSLKEQHYDDLAKSVDTLDDAWQVLSITLSNLVEAILLPLTPIIVEIVNAVTNAVNAIKPFIQTLQGATDALPDWLKDAGWAAALAVGLYYVGTVIMGTVVPALAAAAVAAIDFAIAMLANPWTYVLLALVAIAYAIYEVGKAFGWWTDVSSMLEAISAGLQRLWSAFISNPDVQAFIQALSDGFNVLMEIVGQVGQAILDFFGINNSGEFDIVRALIDAVGMAWNNLKTILQPVITLVMGVISAFNQFRTGQIDLPTFIMSILTLLFQAYQTVFGMVVSFVVSVGARLVAAIRSAASRMVNGMISYLRQLPGRVYSALIAVVSRISSAIQSWITTASSKVSSLISSITSPFSGIASTISSALSGVVEAITAPFRNAWAAVEPYVSKLQDAANFLGIGGAQAGEESYGRASLLDDAVREEANNVSTNNAIIDNSPVTVDHNLNISLDLKNVPSGMDSDTLIAALTDRKVLSALTGNSDFQLFDGKAKERLNLKVNRSRGV